MGKGRTFCQQQPLGVSVMVEDLLRLKMLVQDFPASEAGAFALLRISIIDERSGLLQFT